jgi:hypothetical protein
MMSIGNQGLEAGLGKIPEMKYLGIWAAFLNSE